MDRREFFGKVGIRTAALLGLCGVTGKDVFSKPPAKRPNIVLIMADDMGYSDIGCYGSEIHTPNLDGLAAKGLRFTQFYNSARCCPTRASLLTGLYPHQAGVGHMIQDRGFPAYQGYLNDRCVTIAEALKRAGYRTLMAGKWHVGENRPRWPLDRGFDRYFGLISGASNYFQLDEGRKMAMDNEPFAPAGDGYYMTDAFTEYAVRFLDDTRGKDDPFFLYVAYTSPHWPLHAWPADIAKYRGKYKNGWEALRSERYRRMVQMGLVQPYWTLSPRDSLASAWADVPNQDVQDLKMAVYAAQIDRMDQNIGRIVVKLKDLGAMDNTLVLFLADNGGCAEVQKRTPEDETIGSRESFQSYGPGWANASNTPFRLFKHWVHEGGISSPLIAHWPGVIRKPGITHQVGHLVDIMATCLDIGGADYPKTFNGHNIVPLEGRSLVPIFRDGIRKGHDFLFWEHEGNRAVRQGKWKLVSKYPYGWELYDIEKNRSELIDMAAAYPEKIRELAGAYDAWAKRSGVIPWGELNIKK